MARAVAAEAIEGKNKPEVTPEAALQSMCLLAVPDQTYRALSDAAAKRGMTVAQFLKKAVDDALVKNEDGEVKPRRLLTEEK